ncbi:MAG: DNA polymerase III subunit delta' [Candidatus Omnitrophota bacterium]|nr:DNA polymerase III subunit delta' [Candidatus Omnitrophota bacterium]
MILLGGIKGQDNAVKYLSNCVKSGRIAGSFLFSGPEGIGRALTAKSFIKALMCRKKTEENSTCEGCFTCAKIDKGTHPDIVWIKPEKNKNIKIEEIRKVKEVLSLKPYTAGLSVCIVEDAHMMTQSAANALLKILEEPPKTAVLILITSRKELLLQTVVSRCSEVRFSCLSVELAKGIILEKSNLTESEAYFLACLAQGSPGKALEMMNEDIGERKSECLAMLEQIIDEDSSVCLDWPKEGKDYLMEDIEMMIMFFRDVVMGKEGLKSSVFDRNVLESKIYQFFKKCGINEIYRTIEKLIDIKRALAGNVNPKLVAQILPESIKTASCVG